MSRPGSLFVALRNGQTTLRRRIRGNIVISETGERILTENSGLLQSDPDMGKSHGMQGFLPGAETLTRKTYDHGYDSTSSSETLDHWACRHSPSMRHLTGLSGQATTPGRAVRWACLNRRACHTEDDSSSFVATARMLEVASEHASQRTNMSSADTLTSADPDHRHNPDEHVRSSAEPA